MDLFGRKGLKEQIEELENELASCREDKDELERQRDKHQRRFKDAETEKQEAQRELKKARTKIETLQDRISETDDDEQHTITETVRLDEMDDLRSTVSSLTYGQADAITRARTKDDRGIVTFFDPYLISIRIETPLPVDPLERRQDSFVTSPIDDLISGRYLLLHLSAGGSGAAIIDDHTIKEHTIIDSDIKSDHKKGGYSQKRFEKIRDQQLQEHIDTFIDETEAIRSHGVDDVIVTGSPQPRKQFIQDLDEADTKTRGTPVSKIRDKDDLLDAFNGVMTFEIERVPPDVVQERINT